MTCRAEEINILSRSPVLSKVHCVCCFSNNWTIISSIVIPSIHSAIYRKEPLTSVSSLCYLMPIVPAVTGTPVCSIHVNVGTITLCLMQLILMLVHIEWLFWGPFEPLSCVFWRLCVWAIFSTILLFFPPSLSLFFFPSVLWPWWHPPPQLAHLKSKSCLSFDEKSQKIWCIWHKGLGIYTSIHVLADGFHWDGWFLSWICAEILFSSLMLFRLYSIREDYLNVSNVDLYYTNNSQVYVGLFLFLKIHFLILWKIFRSERLKTIQFWQK